MANLRVEESCKLMSPNSDLSFGELESNHHKQTSPRSSSSDFPFRMHKPRSSWGFRIPNGRQFRLLASVGAALAVAVFLYLLWMPSRGRTIPLSAPSHDRPKNPGEHVTPETSNNVTLSEHKWVKPEGFKIIGLLFCELKPEVL